MGVEIIARTGREAYYDAVQHALGGHKRAPRGEMTRDAGFTTILLETPHDALPLGVGRSPLQAIGAVEALQLIGGVSRPDLMFKISPKFREYADAAGQFHGAYGSRVKAQMVSVANKLRNDPSTRQAVVTLWDEYLDNLPDQRDYPCTVALQFQLDDGRLCMNTVMRSNDVWLGLAYDMFQFTQLQMTLARSLGRECGWYRHTAMSLHAYERDVENLVNIRPASGAGENMPDMPVGLGLAEQSFSQIMFRARRIMSGINGIDNDSTASERWFIEKMAPYVNAEVVPL